MLDKGRISSVQLMLVLFMVEMATAFLLVPSIVAQAAGPDGWLSILGVATAYGLAVALICVALGKRFPFQVFTEYLPEVLGRVPGKLLAAAYTVVFIHLTSVVVGENSLFIHTAFLRETPLLIIDLMMVGAAVYGVYLGVEVLARANEVVFPIFILSITILLALVAREIDLDHLRPVLANGLLPVLKGAMVPAAWRGEVFFLLLLYPYLNQKNEALKSAAGTVLISGVFAAAVTAITIGVFSDLVASRQIYPVLNLARYISVAGILERLELYLIIIWMAGVIIKLAVFYHSCSVMAASTLGLKDYRVTVFPIALATIIISGRLYESDYLKLVEFLSKFWPFYGYTVELLIPGLILLVAVIRKKGGDRVDF
ncbi:MAG: endospore germination permease [Firmicutes bacterium]|nr:endospore germination permease [Bacillota bacterium]